MNEPIYQCGWCLQTVGLTAHNTLRVHGTYEGRSKYRCDASGTRQFTTYGGKG